MVTSAISLSVDPATTIVCVNRNASAMSVIARCRHFFVNVFAVVHQHIAERFTGRTREKGAARYQNAEWRPSATAAPALHYTLVGAHSASAGEFTCSGSTAFICQDPPWVAPFNKLASRRFNSAAA
jgi:flavin reductase (DIM6/NTAB) family NADH-FMN oxidoreductase RutF